MTADALNAICPYYTMYPLSFPLRVLRKYGQPNDWVLDPFCGRGTTNFAARLLGLPSIGVDSSPVAAALASAKLATSTPERIVAAAEKILGNATAPDVPDGEFWRLAYHDETLLAICRLREALLQNCRSHTRILLRAIVLGALHGPRPKRHPSHLSNQSPRTFAPKPRYAVNYWRTHGMTPERIDVLSIIRTRAKRYLSEPLPRAEGMVSRLDSRDPTTFRILPSARLVVTSPPYYGMRTYLPDQWLRLWFLGGAADVEYTQRHDQLSHKGATVFASELRQVWSNVAAHTVRDARLVIRFGGIHDRQEKPMDVLRESLRGSGWRITTARPARDSDHGKRQVRQFQQNPKKAIREYDVYCARAR